MRSKELAQRALALASSHAANVRAADEFTQQMLAAAAARADERPTNRPPFASVQRISTEMARSPRTEGEAEIQRLQRAGYDPGTNKFFETASDANQYRKAAGVTIMSKADLESEAASRGTSSCRVKMDEPLNTNVKGFNRNAFIRGAEVLRGGR